MADSVGSANTADVTAIGNSLEEALGERLMSAGMIDARSLERATRLSAESGDRIDRVLTKLGMVTETDMAGALAAVLDLSLAGPGDYPDHKVLEAGVGARFLREYCIMPLAESEDAVALAMADPLDSYAIKAMELNAGKKIQPWVGAAADIEAAIDRVYGDGGATLGDIVEDIGDGAAGVGVAADGAAEDDIERLKDLASEAPVIRLVNLIIGRAVEARASDIHIEPFEAMLRVRYRIDGVLQEVDAPPNRLRAAVISRIKIMARLNIAERRLPQDGRVKLAIRGREIDLRVSTVPTMHGESMVLRVLDRSQSFDLSSLGFGDAAQAGFQELLRRPHGIVIVTGPTGSGKTTSLYAALLELNTPERKILTVEDPIEYQLEGINQIQVRPQIGLNFTNILRSMLRQDPDVMMIGEIRDLETAEIAVQAALTGHLVLSTLHTNNAASTIPRLLDMGVEDYLLTSTVNGIVAQRLVRTLCTQCRLPETPLPGLVEQLGLKRFSDGGEITLYKAVGCDGCNGTGFRGRTTILELLIMTDELRQLVLGHVEVHRIEQAAHDAGMRGMYEDGARKALAGLTTIEEVLRATRVV